MEIRIGESCPNECGGGVLAMAFVNMQPFEEVYNLCEGFERGTIFPALDKPFMPGGMKK